MKRYILIIFALLFMCSTPVFAQEDAEYFDKEFNVVLNGGIGTGVAAYAISKDKDKWPDSGGGSYGTHISLNGLINFMLLGLEFSYNRSSLNDTEYTTEVNGSEHGIESTGSGKYETFDFKVGLFFATEPEDMGYTFFYAGYRAWTGEYDTDKVVVDGVVNLTPDYLIDNKVKGSGYIFGYRDFSTIPIPLTHIGIIFRTGFWVVSAPGDSVTINGDKKSYKSSNGIGFGFEIGTGIAIEDIGLAIDLRWRLDGTVTYGELKDNSDFSAAYGSSTYILSATYIF